MTPEDASPALPPWISGPSDWTVAILTILLVAFPPARSAIMTFARRPAPVAPLTPNQSAILQSSLLLYQQGRYQDAITVGQMLVAQNPSSSEAFNIQAVSYAALFRWDDALRSAATAVRLRPDFQLAKNNLAWILDERASVTPAREEGSEYFVALSARQYQARQFRECIGSAQQALKVKPGLANALNNMGACYAALGLLDDAIRSDSAAVRIQPDHQLAKNNLAWALQQKKLRTTHAGK